MKKITFFIKPELTLSLFLIFFVLSIQNSNSQTYCIQPGADQITGEKDGYRYELWDQNAQGTACITIGSGALFSGEWSDIENYLARRGLGYNQTLEHQDIGIFYSTYTCNYNPSSEAGGNSYLSIYGWTVNPLIEYYIIENWRNWIPSMASDATLKGTLEVNGSIYDIYETTRVNQPSIIGNTTFQQYFSIRRTVRNSGTINISEHFNKWESLGMDMGKMHEVSFVVEGYKSSGSFEFTNLDVFTSNEPPVSVKGESIGPSYVSVYSDSNSGNVTIKIDDSVLKASINIYDESGKVVFSQKNINNNLLQVSNLKKGIYFVNVYNNALNYNTKILVY